jgi:hypothetical protein
MRGKVSRTALWLFCVCILACAEGQGARDKDAGEAAESDAGAARAVAAFDGELHRAWLTSGSYYTLSSPRAADLNGDGVLDIVTGHGAETQVLDFDAKDFTTFGSVSAHSGSDGRLLWEFTARQDMVGSAVFLNIDDDAVPDVVIGGRYTELVALRGSDGTLIWRFFAGTVDEARAQHLYNFYSPIVLEDLDGDGVRDLVAANGGDPTKQGSDSERPAGKLLALSGRTGAVLGMISMPDAAETYMSPTLLVRDEPEIVFGSGGETLPGGLWRIPVSALLQSDGARATLLARGQRTGFIAPASLVDLTGDGVDDVVAVSFGAELVAIDGHSNAVLFQRTLDGLETYATPVVAEVTGDGVPDLWLSADEGRFPTYTSNQHVLLDGASGEILFEQRLGTTGPSGHVAADLNGDGLDELLVGTNRSDVDLSQVTDTMFQVPLHYELSWFDPVARVLHPIHEAFSRPGVSAPLLEDLDGDGDLELVLVTSDVGNAQGKYRLERFELHAQKPTRPFSGAYMGARYDGRWNPPAEAPREHDASAEAGAAERRWQSQSLKMGIGARSESVELTFAPASSAFSLRALPPEAETDPNLCFALEEVVVNGDQVWVDAAGIEDFGEYCSHCSQRVSLSPGYGMFALPSASPSVDPIARARLRVALRECDSLLPWPAQAPRPSTLRLEWAASTPPEAGREVTLRVGVALASERGFARGVKDPQLVQALAFAAQVLREADIAVDWQGPVALAAPASPLRFAPGARAPLDTLGSRARAALASRLTPRAALLLLTPCLMQDDSLSGSPRLLGGYTPHIPGGFGIAGAADGAFVAVETCGGLEPQPRFLAPEALGAVIAHELGHFLGLYHVLEADGTEDLLVDTDPRATNLMQRMPAPDAVALSPDQVRVMRRHLAVAQASSPGE